jgi:uncharacterized protein YqgC (DUF456 family)
MLYLVWTLAIFCVVVGVFGTVFPALPGTPLIFIGALAIAWWYDFTILGIPSLAFLGLLAALGVAVDFIASTMGAKRVGASTLAIIGATVGSIVGIFFALPGIILGPFIGAFMGELVAQSSLRHATKVGIGTWIGLLVGTATKVAIALTMVGFMVFSMLI